MAIAFSTMKEFEGRRVRMRFDDGAETVGRLISAVEDMDGEHHLIYDEEDGEAAMYAEGESLVSIEALEPESQGPSLLF